MVMPYTTTADTAIFLSQFIALVIPNILEFNNISLIIFFPVVLYIRSFTQHTKHSFFELEQRDMSDESNIKLRGNCETIVKL